MVETEIDIEIDPIEQVDPERDNPEPVDPDVVDQHDKRRLFARIQRELEERIKDRYPPDVPFGLSEALSQSELTRIRVEAQQIRSAANALRDRVRNNEKPDARDDSNWPFEKSGRRPFVRG